jgi:ribosomal protein L37E
MSNKKSKHREGMLCPECEVGHIKIKVQYLTCTGISYVEKYEYCDECGYERQLTNNRRNYNKQEIAETSSDL